MKKRFKKLVRLLKKYARMAKLATKKIRRGEYRGSNRASLKIRLTLEKISLRQWIGINLAGAAFFGAIIVPQSSSLASSLEIVFETPQNIITVGPSLSTYQWPLTTFGISQQFSVVHPGMDLTDPAGTPIYPVSEGTVVWTKSLPFGYGNHVLVDDGNGVQSLYAHMTRIDVKEGDHVTKYTELGEVGATGWATGNHLHLEVYTNGTATNPLDVLPQLPEPTK